MKTLSDPEVYKSVRMRLESLTSNMRPRWGRMSAHQMLCHLSDSYKTATGERLVGLRSGLFQRTVMKWVALRVPLEWPKNLKTMPENDQGIGGTRPIEFEDDRRALLAIIDDFRIRDAASMHPNHPLFGPMNHGDWMRWGFLHADHHLRQFGV